MRAPLAFAGVVVALVVACSSPASVAPTAQVATPTVARAATPTRPAPTSAPATSRARPTVPPAATLVVATPTAAPPPAPVLDGLLDSLVPDSSADYSMVLEDLASGARTSLNDTQSFPSASLYKLGVAWAVMRRVDAGTLSLDSTVTIEDQDAVEPEPDGGMGAGDEPTIRDLLAAMLSISSNASAHALLRILNRDDFTAEMDRIGLSQTRVPDDGLAVTSAADIAHLLRLIATSPDLSPSAHALIADDMANIAPPDALRDSLPESVGIRDKTGNLEDASNVGALLATPRGTAILVVIDSGVDPGDARAIIAQAGQIAYRALLE